MPRAFVSVLIASLALWGCSAEESAPMYEEVAMDAVAPPAPPPGAPGMFNMLAGAPTRGAGNASGPDQQAQSGESYIYDHSLSLSMASDFIKSRFERARDLCANDPALKCKVMSASFTLRGNPSAPLPVAYLSVGLPHDSVAPFEASLTVPLEGEDKGDIVVRSRATNAQNVTQQVTDLDRRLAQATDYRTRLLDLSKRRNATTDDLIKIEGELSKTQSEIEALEAQKRALAERIAKENLTITFEGQSTAGDAFQPVRDVWQSALRILGESTGAALGFIIRIIPWLPLIVALFYLVPWLWRRFRRKPA